MPSLSAVGDLVSTGLLRTPKQDRRELEALLQEREERQWLRWCLWGRQEGKVFVPGPLYWLQNHTKTYDEKWKEKGVEAYRAFPRLPFFPWVMSGLMEAERAFVPKSREMVISWLVIGYGVWTCQFFPKQRVMVQTQKEDKVADLIGGRGTLGYAATLYEHQDEWLKQRCPLAKPLKDQPATLIAWANESVLQGVPKGADQIRQYHPTIYIADEAAHLDEFQESYASADPVCGKIIAVSSAAPSWFGDVCTGAMGVKQ